MLEMQSEFIVNCKHSECAWERDVQSAEVKVTYLDLQGGNHIVWFEDEISVKRKEQFLNSRGITSFAYWAHTFF
jgi:spore germination protein YaaH